MPYRGWTWGDCSPAFDGVGRIRHSVGMISPRTHALKVLLVAVSNLIEENCVNEACGVTVCDTPTPQKFVVHLKEHKKLCKYPYLCNKRANEHAVERNPAGVIFDPRPLVCVV